MTNIKIKLLALLALSVVTGLVLVACEMYTVSGAERITLAPTSGGPDTQVTIHGKGFPAAMPLNVRLGPPSVGATPQSYGSGVTDTRGEFILSFTLPGQWPDGTPITQLDLLVVVLNEDGSIGATAPFDFQPDELLQPKSSLDPGSGVPGQEAGVTGQSFPSNDQPETGLTRSYTNDEGDFSLLLPSDWVVLGPAASPMGSQYLLGEPPLAQSRLSDSTLFVADASQLSTEEALKRLCDGCEPVPELQDGVVNGMEAELATVGGEGAPAVEWVFVERGAKLIYFTIHDPETLESLDGVIQTFSPGSNPTGPATISVTQVARQWLATHLDINPYAIVIASAGSVEWPDACLGIRAAGETCAQVETPGVIGMLQTQDAQYEFRVDESGNNVRVTPGAVLNARQVIAQQLHTNLDAVTIESFESVQWPDVCLGVPAEGEGCAKVVTPGYRVILEAASQRYAVHTDESGGALRLATASVALPESSDVSIIWTFRGDAGCETARFGSVTVAFAVCGGAMMLGRYAAPERTEAFTYFVQTYAPFEAETPAGQVRFTGQGSRVATPAEQRMVAEWARLAAAEARAGRSGASWGLSLAWHREGGIAGFCDDLAVYVTGDVFGSSCQGGLPQNLGRQRLTAGQLEQLYAWIDAWQGFELSQTDQATADALTIRMVFSGVGTTEAREADRQALQDWAVQLINGFDQ